MANKKNQLVSGAVSHYFLTHLLAFKLSFRNLSMTPMASILTMAAIGMCLSFPVGLIWFIKNVQQISHGLNEGSAVSLYINNKSTAAQIEALQAKINTFPFVKKSTYITPESALQEFQASSGLKDTLALLPENPLPGVISIDIDTRQASKAQISQMQESLSVLPQVMKTVFDYEWVNKLNAVLSFGKSLAQCLYFIIGVGVMLMVSNTIRLALERHKDELDVLNLIGASTAFIRRPFLYRGVLYGALGGVFAILVIKLMNHFLSGQAKILGSLFDDLFFLENFTFYDTVLLLTVSASLGWIGAILAFIQQNRALAHDNT